MLTTFLFWSVITGFILYYRMSLFTWTASTGVLLCGLFLTGTTSIFAWLLFAVIAIPLNIKSLRMAYLSLPAFRLYKKIKPSISQTEREALEAGTTWWEGDLFRGKPDWHHLHQIPTPRLSAEEQAFLEGPVEEVCAMVNDWEITHETGDLPTDVWNFLKAKRFFAMIIPKAYGGLEFSAFAHSQVLVKLNSVSGTLSSTVAVPNSLGPAELLMHYGTQDQKEHYLPRLAEGKDIPCFALTGPEAGSDAGAIPDKGVICKGMWEGTEILGMRLTWNKRYITLAPVATVLGLAFKLYDPEKLIGDKVNLGITCALIPTDTEGVEIGRRHFPVNVAFQNGPTKGTDVFVPLDWIIGGQSMAGQGWRMLVECLSVGRSISLPSSAVGGAKMCSLATGAYSRIRSQFKIPIGKMEGVEEALARIAGNTYVMDAARSFTAGAVDIGEKPSVPSAIVKYHVTHRGREVINDAMDIHGGKAIMMGPNNYLARAYQGVPVGITVEGANILTRSMIIFGQGAIRCHPFVLAELEAANAKDENQGLKDFDRALFGHVGFAMSNFFRSAWFSLTGARFVTAPYHDATQKHYQTLTRISANLALLSDITMAVLGAELKRREKLSGRLGDILSQLYLASSTLKFFDDQGRNEDDLPLVHWAIKDCVYQAQQAMVDILDNYPNRNIGALLRFVLLPFGRFAQKPSDRLGHSVAKILLTPNDTRARLGYGAFTSEKGDNPIGVLERTLKNLFVVEPLIKRLREGLSAKDETVDYLVTEGVRGGLISEEEGQLISQTEQDRKNIIDVDDFEPDKLFPHQAEKGLVN